MIRLELLTGAEVGRVGEYVADEIRIGRSDRCGFSIGEFHVSGEHAVLSRTTEGLVIRDNQSTNGTRLVRGSDTVVVDRQSSGVAVEHGDILELGDVASPVRIRVHLLGEDDSAQIVSVRHVAELETVFAEETSDRELLRSLNEAQKSISGIHNLDALLDEVAAQVFRFLPRATHMTVALMNEKDGSTSNQYNPVGTRVRGEYKSDEPVPITRSVFRKVVRDRSAVLAADARVDVGQTESLMAAQILSTIGVPLWIGEQIFGVLQVDNRAARGVFRESDLDRLALLAQPTSQAFNTARLIARLERAEERLKNENLFLKRDRAHRFRGIIGDSPAMRGLLTQLEKVVPTRVTVLIEGETGTGKELIARAVHHWSSRKDQLFVPQNCAALPENLLESELFGHKKGAFTGATEDKKGLFVLADGGTLFLDEVGEMPLSLQAKLLRVLQEGEVRPIGEGSTRRVDVRIVAATNRNLEKEVAEGRFREDLFYRLRVFPVRVPPLRERPTDLPALVDHFLQKYSEEFGRPLPATTPELIALFSSYPWPGNVRELENEVQRLIIQAEDHKPIGLEMASAKIRSGAAGGTVGAAVEHSTGTLKEMMERFEKRLLAEALAKHGQNKSATARTLGITREGLHKKLRNYGMT